MRSTTLAATAALAALALPIVAGVKAMDLAELMEITNDVMHGEIVGRSSFADGRVIEHAAYTTLTIEGTSLRTGETGVFEVSFLGSHDPDDDYRTSVMPNLADVRVGNEVVVFTFEPDEFPGQRFAASRVDVYRVERAFGDPVVMGKGPGTAFPGNERLTTVVEQVRETHEVLQAAAQPLLK